MTAHYNHRRLSDPAATFPALIGPGEIAVNTANRQITVGDANASSPGAPLNLLAVRLFDVRAQYAVNDYVVNGGGFYRANVAVTPGAFNASQWDVYITNTDAKTYADAGDAAVTAAFEAADDTLTTAVNGKVAKNGDSMTGFLSLYADPQSSMHAATKQYVDAEIAAGGQTTMPAANIVYTPPGDGTVNATDVQNAISELDYEKAPVYSPNLQGIPTTETPTTGDNSTKIANTAWVQNYTTNYVVGYVGTYFTSQAALAQPLMDGTVAVGTSLKYAREDHRHPTDTSRAPLNSPAFTGNPIAPTPNQSSNGSQLATTAFVVGRIGGFATILDPAFSGNPTAPTPPPGDNDTSVATTAFVTAAVQAAISGLGIAQPVRYLFGSGIVVVPAGASQCEVTLQGASGGAQQNTSYTGAGATLYKLLTGLTPGGYLNLTIGLGGVQAGGLDGGATTLASGTISIQTLVAGGGAGDHGAASISAAGGIASNGDLNLNGQAGSSTWTRGGNSWFGYGGGSTPGTGWGSGLKGGGQGKDGLAIIRWFP
jgi:hypothetical protein